MAPTPNGFLEDEVISNVPNIEVETLCNGLAISEDRLMAFSPKHRNVVAKVLSVLTACKVDKIVRQKSVFSKGSNRFSEKMGAKKISAVRKAGILVDTVLATVTSGPTDAGWNNLGVIVDDIVEGRHNVLDLDGWLDLAAVFMDMASKAASWTKELRPSNRLQRTLEFVYPPFLALRTKLELEDLQENIAISICKAGLFLGVINQSGRLSAIVNAESNRLALESYVKDLERYLGILYSARLLEGLESLWEELKKNPFNLPYARSSSFCGRQEEMTLLHKSLFRISDDTENISTDDAVAVSYVIAPSGYEKSQFALEYAYRHLAEYEGVLWVNASSLNIVDSYLQLGRLLKLQLKENDIVLRRVQQVKEALEDGHKYLVIFDSLENHAVLYDLLPKKGKAHIIVTSKFASNSSHDMELGPFNIVEAVEVLKRSWELKLPKDDSFTKCLELVEFLPLGVAIIMHLFAAGVDTSNLLQLLQNDTGNIPVLEETFQNPSRMKVLIEESLSQLGGLQKELVVLMVEVSAWFGADAIPKELLVVSIQNLRVLTSDKGLLLKDEDVNNALNTLFELHFAKEHRVNTGIVFHPILQNYGRAQKSSLLARTSVLKTLAGALCCDVTVPHFAAMWQQRKDNLENEDLGKISNIGFKLVQYWSWEGRAADCMAACEELLNHRKFSSVPELRAKVRLLKARVLSEIVGDLVGCDKELQICNKENRWWQKSTPGLVLQVELAWIQVRNLVFTSEGKSNSLFSKSKSLVATLTPLRIQAMTLSSAIVERDEGGSYGKFSEIRDDDAIIGDAFVKLAEALKELKSITLGESVEMLNQGLRVWELTLPPTDHRITWLLEKIGEAYVELREFTEQQQLIQDAFRFVVYGGLKDCEPSFGWKPCQNSLSDLHFTHEQRKDACLVYEKQLAQTELLEGIDVLKDSNIVADLGLTMRGPLVNDILEKAKYSLEGALIDIQSSSKTSQRKGREEYIRSSQSKLGLVQFCLEGWDGLLAESMKWLEESLIKEVVPEEKGSSVPVNCAHSIRGIKDDEARNLRGRYVRSAWVLIRRGAVDEAEKYLLNALHIAESCHSSIRFEVGRIYALLGAVEWLRGGELKIVLDYLESARKVIREEFGDVNLEVADILDCIGRVKEQEVEISGNKTLLGEAYKAYSASYDIRKNMKGVDHPILAFNLADLAGVEGNRGKQDSSSSLLKKSFSLLQIGRVGIDDIKDELKQLISVPIEV